MSFGQYDKRGSNNPKWRGGMSKHPLYYIWHDMRSRCKNPAHSRWDGYGGRGITVCERWDNDFWAFVADMGDRPERVVLDRIDNDSGYRPDNCRWADYSTSAKNRRTSGWETRTRNGAGQFI